MRRVLIVLSLAGFCATTALAAQPPRAKVLLRSTSLGSALVDVRGHSLYLRTRGTCTGACAAVWPPLFTTGKPLAGSGLKAKLLGTVKRGAKLQVTYAGHPLFLFAKDAKAGDLKGEGVSGVWFLVDANGNYITKTPDTTPTPPGYGGGYGP